MLLFKGVKLEEFIFIIERFIHFDYVFGIFTTQKNKTYLFINFLTLSILKYIFV
jgi:hypothetical protein